MSLFNFPGGLNFSKLQRSIAVPKLDGLGGLIADSRDRPCIR